MSVTREAHGILYHCYRDSCGVRGFLPTSGVLLQGSPEPRKSRLRPYYGKFWPLTSGGYPMASEWFVNRFAIVNLANVGLNENGKYVFEVPDPYNRVRGYLVREVRWGDKPPTTESGEPIAKTRVFMHQDGPVQAWYRPPTNWPKEIILVEDAVSAIKLRELGFTGVALLGTELNEEKVREIAQQKPTEVVIALDQDATGTAFKLARRWGLAWPKVRVALLTRDIKDMPIELIPEALGL